MGRLTKEQWQTIDALLDHGAKQTDVALAHGISLSAITKHRERAGLAPARRAGTKHALREKWQAFVELVSGGNVHIIVYFNFQQASPEDRAFVGMLLDEMRAYREAHQGKGVFDDCRTL
jgi:hypothetical protein